MTIVIEKSLAPECGLMSTRGSVSHLREYRGHYVVLYFYPRDATPGCTTQSCDFAKWHACFSALNAVVIGVSRDSIASHQKFKAKYQLPFDLWSDELGEVCQQYGVLKLKNLYGKQALGIERSTFLIDPQGLVLASWRKVKVPGHVEAVLAVLQAQAHQTSC